MVFAGIIAFIVVFAIMTVMYRLPGVLACVGLLGQVAATLAFVSGYFPVFNSFTPDFARHRGHHPGHRHGR